MERIIHSITLAYVTPKNKEFQKYLQLIQENPTEAFKDTSRLEKPFAFIIHAWRTKLWDKDQLKKALDNLILSYFKQVVSVTPIDSLIKPEVSEQEKASLQEYFKSQLDSFFALADFRKAFHSKFTDFFKTSDREVEVGKAYLYNNDINLPLSLVERLYHDITGEKVEKHSYPLYVFHVHLHKDQCLVKPISHNWGELKAHVFASIDEKSIIKLKGFSELYKSIEDAYIQTFQKRHFDLEPLSKAQIQDLCKERNLNFADLTFDGGSELCNNACVSPACPFFLQAREKFNRHLGAWQGKMPIGFHRFVKARHTLELDDLYQKSTKKWKGFPEKFAVDKDFAMKYIKLVKEGYSKLEK